MRQKHELKFRENGTFYVLQLADVQQETRVSLDTVRLMDALLDTTRPDLVVYTGDQLKGYARDFKTDTRHRVRQTINKITAPVRRRGIPFTVTFGNHDEQAGLSNGEQREMYAALPGCLMPDTGPDAGTFQLRVKSADGGRDAMAIYLVDSGGGSHGLYWPVRPEQNLWLQRAHMALNRENKRTVPGLVFQHIPVPEYYDLLVKLPCWDKEAVYGIGRKQGCFALNKRLCRRGGVLAEAPGIPQGNSGELAVLQSTPGIFALFCGHDHRNTYSGKIGNIELGYTPSCGFDAYGPGIDRGGRLFVFQQEDPADFETHVYTYRELVGGRPVRPLRNFIDSVIPASVDEAKRMAGRLALALAFGGAVWGAAHTAKCKKP